MRHVFIDASDHYIETSCILLGTAGYDREERAEDAFRLYDRYVELGGRGFDTARIYGFGKSEEILGRWLKGRSDRQSLTVITKGAHPSFDRENHRLVPRLNRDALREDVEASLKALGTHIDLYMPHRDDLSVSVDEVVETLGEYVRSHDIRAIGASNWKLDRIDEANRRAFERGLPEFVASEVQWSLAFVGKEALSAAYDPTCVGLFADGEYAGYRRRNTLLLAYSSLAWGYFSKRLEGREPKHAAELAGEENDHRLELVRRWCEGGEHSAAQVSLSYILCHPEINAAAIVGCSSVEQLEDIMHAGDYCLPYSFYEELGEVAARARR